MLIRQFAFLFVLFLVALPATASAQISMTVLGLYSYEGDDDVARQLTEAIRTNGSRVPQWRMNDVEASTSQMELAHSCQLFQAECRAQVLATMGTGAMIYGSMSRIMGASGTEEELLIRIFRYDALETRVMHAGEIRLSRSATREMIDAEAVRVIQTLAADDPPIPAPPPLDEDEVTVDVVAHHDEVIDVPIARPAPASFNHEWAGVVLIGLGAALVLADIPVWVRLGDLNSDPSMIDYRHRLALGATGDACTNASAGNALPVPGLDPTTATMQVGHVRGICSEGESLEIAQYVLPVIGVLLGVTGATLLGTGVLVSPSVSTDRATLTVSGSF